MYLISKLYSLDKHKQKIFFVKKCYLGFTKGFDLAMDIYSPTKGEFFSGLDNVSWRWFLLRRKYIIENMAQYIASNYDYVVCNVDYRLLKTKKLRNIR